MSSKARPPLTIDDPLAPRTPRPNESATAGEAPPEGDALGEPTAREPSRRPRPRRPADRAPQRAGERDTAEGSSSRPWAESSRVASYRLPDELLDELNARTRRLELPIGLTVAAALVEFLDRDDAAITAVVDALDDARHRARRAARRAR